ncbi:hypothetical protein CDCA_CDCA01G0014 [Cyanidium caldarium]|uniref:Serine/threonine-protein kinase PLK n=1 Tax=Cyanidium caldarium TaxID=2771 RepID=A0AAV9IPC0_CYACA|nr:hypothetical protein CDCA_CDCA01G0014 [Cyanidium caldarium]
MGLLGAPRSGASPVGSHRAPTTATLSPSSAAVVSEKQPYAIIEERARVPAGTTATADAAAAGGALENLDTSNTLGAAGSNTSQWVLGPVVNTYIRGRLLGKGGFAKCFEMTNAKTQRVYAGKIIAKSTVTKMRARQKLRSEIQIHASLRHPHVVQFEHFFEDDEYVYILLELCDAQTMMELVKRRKRLTEPEARYFMVQILDALEYMHRRCVIHRDIKLGNVFLTRDLQVKIGDFGLAAKLEYDHERKKTICGTPNYIAPEVLSGKNGHSYEVDVWSVGVVLYTMLIGKPPFETTDVKTTYKRIKANIYTFPTNVSISRAARELIVSTLNATPEQRPRLSDIWHSEFMQGPVPRCLPRSAMESEPTAAELELEGGAVTAAGSVRDLPPPLPAVVLPPLLPMVPEAGHPPAGVVSRGQRGSGSLYTDCRSDGHTGSTGGVEEMLQQMELGSAGSRASQPVAGAAMAQLQRVSSAGWEAAEVDEEERGMLCRAQHELATSFARLPPPPPPPPPSSSSAAPTLPAAAPFQIADPTRIVVMDELPASTATLPPDTWICKWVDYATKYGVGYQLSNGNYGVYFNDASKVLLYAGGNAQEVDYVERRRLAFGSYDDWQRVRLSQPGETLRKKVTLLQHFRQHLDEHLPPGQEPPQSCGTGPPEASPSGGALAAPRPVHLKRWMRTRHAMIFRLSNRTIQVDFFDTTQLVLSAGQSLVTYRDKRGRRIRLRLNAIPHCLELVKRLRYLRDILGHLTQAHAAPVASAS